MDDVLRRRQIRDEQFNSFDCWNSDFQAIRSFNQFRCMKSIDSIYCFLQMLILILNSEPKKIICIFFAHEIDSHMDLYILQHT